jgi:hypothetical protein
VRVARKNGRSISFFLDFFSLFDQAKRDGLRGQEADKRMFDSLFSILLIKQKNEH